MNYYTMEMLMRERQHELLREAEMRRLAAIGRGQRTGHGPLATTLGRVAAIARTVRTLVVPGRKPVIDHAGLSDAS